MPADKANFPAKIYQILETEDAEIIHWEQDGKTFRILDYERFEKEVISKHFRHSRLASVQRQLNLYGFKCVQRGINKGAFFHPEFLRGSYEKVREIRRVLVIKKNQGHTKPIEDSTECPQIESQPTNNCSFTPNSLNPVINTGYVPHVCADWNPRTMWLAPFEEAEPAWSQAGLVQYFHTNGPASGLYGRQYGSDEYPSVVMMREFSQSTFPSFPMSLSVAPFVNQSMTPPSVMLTTPRPLVVNNSIPLHSPTATAVSAALPSTSSAFSAPPADRDTPQRHDSNDSGGGGGGGVGGGGDVAQKSSLSSIPSACAATLPSLGDYSDDAFDLGIMGNCSPATISTSL